MLIKSIETIISKNIGDFISQVSDKWNIDSSELEEIWNSVAGDSAAKKKKAPKKKDDDSSESVSTEKSSKSKNKNVEGGCPYVFIKGKDEGKTCNSKPKEGGEYCSRHIKCEGVGQKDKKKIPVAKKTVSSSSDKPKTSPAKKPTEKVLRLNKEINKFWNPESGLVFKSKDDRVVIGSYKDEKFEKLTSDDIANCEKYGFKYEFEMEPKKSLSEEIVKTNMNAELIENVLDEIGLGDIDEEEEEEYDEEEMEEFEEEE